jgi:cyanophycinase
MRFFIVFFVYWLMSFAVLAQGKLLLVGGGSEKQNGWSDAPYSWAVDQSVNKKVAIVSYQTQDDWLKNYFLSLGATTATNYTISTQAQANLQSTYDNLMTCDVIFLKGGDQSQYYTLYKNTKVEEAIEAKFAAGGVIGGTSAGMAILSKVFFSAENGSLFPPDALESINSPFFSMKNDFLDIFNDYVFDTHFVERGRNTRLMAFLAKWYQQTGNLVKGIGVDDQTALCIDATKVAVCYGTGAVHIYRPQGFTFPNNKINTPDLKAHILLHGHIINLNNFTFFQEGNAQLNPLPDEETANYQVLLSGGEGLTENLPFIQNFIAKGSINDDILIVTGADSSLAFQYKQRMRTEGATGKITILQTLAANNNADKFELRNAIRLSKKVFFVNITSYASFFQFLSSGQTGELLNNHIRRNQMINAFVGDNSKLAGKFYVNNNRSSKFNAYDGILSYSTGLSLLASSTILPNAFNPNDNDFYENNSTAVSFAVAQRKLKFGVYINRRAWVEFLQASNKNWWRAGGVYSAAIFINQETKGDLASEIASSATNQPRNIAGFSEVNYALLNGTSIEAGTPIASNDALYTLESSLVSGFAMPKPKTHKIYPNPAKNYFVVDWKNTSFELKICDIHSTWTASYSGEHSLKISIQHLPRGAYVIILKNKQSEEVFVEKLVLQ